MKEKGKTNSRTSGGRRGRKPSAAARSPLGTTAWRTATLISNAAASSRGNEAVGMRGNTIPVFLIEDNRVLRDSLAAMLSAQGLNVLSTARSGGEALRLVARLKPQLVLVDSAMGDRASLGLVKGVKKSSPSIKVIVMHLRPSRRDVVAFVRAGVSGFIMKDATAAEFVGTIRSVADGVSVLPPLITGKLFTHVAAQAPAARQTR